MTEQDQNWFDKDIAAMDLDYGEKAGLQIYRNYTRSFQEHAIKDFVATINREKIDLAELQRLITLIVNEDARFLPVIVCAFADDLLKAVFKEVLPSEVPGGKASMLGGYGPLSDFAKRIQLAYAFNVLSPDLMEELDRLRSARNAISHSWDLSNLKDFYEKGRLADMHRMEDLLPERKELAEEFAGGFKPLAAFRIRLVWICARLVFEQAAYNRAKKSNLEPVRALYGKPAPDWLVSVGREALKATREIAKQDKK